MKICETLRKENILFWIPIITCLIVIILVSLSVWGLNYDWNLALIATFLTLTVTGVIEVALFLRAEQKEKQAKCQQKLKKHYGDLLTVLKGWSNISVRVLNYRKEFGRAYTELYLATYGYAKGSLSHKRVMQHIYDKEGYPNLKHLFEKLKHYEEKHNKFVASVLDGITKEVKKTLDTFPTLKEYGEGTTNNYYYTRHILHFLHNRTSSLTFYPNDENPDQMSVDGSTVAYAKGDNETLKKLRCELERIRNAQDFVNDFAKIENSITEEEGKLLKDIKSKVIPIIEKLELALETGRVTEKTVKGKCEFELFLDSKN